MGFYCLLFFRFACNTGAVSSKRVFVSVFNVVFMPVNAMCFLSVWASTFDGHVLPVFFVRAQKQVRWVYASTVVACVTHQHIDGNWVNKQLIRNTVCTLIFALNTNFAITVHLTSACPNPTPIWHAVININFRHKTGNQLWCSCN